MNLRLVITAGTLALASTTSYGFPLTFTQMLCTMDAPPLEQHLAEFEAKVERVKRLETRASAHRRHIVGHVSELIRALDGAVEQSACTLDRKVSLDAARTQLERLL